MQKKQELALVYVAITRAVRYLTIIKSSNGNTYFTGAAKSDSYMLEQVQDVPVNFRFVHILIRRK